MAEEKPWLLCRRCIDNLKSRGERVFIGSLAKSVDDAKWDDEPEPHCEWCDEVDDLYEVLR